MNKSKELVEKLWKDKNMWKNEELKKCVLKIIKKMDEGDLKVVYKNEDNKWVVNEWVKKAILMFFHFGKMKKIELGPFDYFDKIPIKKDFDKKGIRMVPQAIARYGSYISPGVVVMPSYINIGAYINHGSMIDTWATIGSCAYVGSRVHVSGGVGIGGVLEPIQSKPVIIEDNVFIGSRCIIVEGVHIEKDAVLGAGVVLTSSTKIIDVTHKEPIIFKSKIPEYSVVIPGTLPKKFNSGIYNVPCALIIGKRKESTNKKTSLNEVLRTYSISLS